MRPHRLPDSPTPPESRHWPRIAAHSGMLAVTGAALLVAIGAWQCVAAGDAINGDGISYVDLARQYARGDWTAFANAYWSPLYPALLGVLFRITGVDAARELLVAQALNVTVLAGCAAVFAWWLRELGWVRDGDGWRRDPLSTPVLAAAWAVFAWHMFRLMGIATVTPDGLVAAIFYAALALLTRRLRGAGLPEAAGFGALLGVGYLAKAVLFPVGLVFALAYPLAARARLSARLRIGITVLACFVATSAPLLIVQSVRAGRPSIGATGSLAYAWYVNREPKPRVTPPEARQAGVAVALRSVPGAVLFADTVPGTFPFWYDASRWSRGTRARFDAAGQRSILHVSMRWYRLIFLWPLALSLVPVVIATASGAGLRWRPWLLLAGPAALLGAYALVHPEGRLAGPGIASVLVVLLAAPRGASGGPTRRLRWAALAALAAILLWDTAGKLREGRFTREPHGTTVALARRLAQVVPPGGDIALAGDPYGHRWAQVAGVRIVATLPEGVSAGTLPQLVRESCALGRHLRAVVRRGPPRDGFVDLGGGWSIWPAPDCPSR